MESVLDKIRAQAKALNRKVCLTESDDPRNLKAAEKLVKLGYARPVLVGCEDEIRKLAQENGVSLDGVEIVDVLKTPELDRYIATVVEIRKNKGLTPEQAREWLKDTCVFSAAMVCAGDAHGYASCGGNPKGYAHNTAQKTKPALQLFKVAPGNKIASSFFIMQMPDPKWGYNGVFVYADCGMNINPNADQLAEIAVTTATYSGDFIRPSILRELTPAFRSSGKKSMVFKSLGLKRYWPALPANKSLSFSSTKVYGKRQGWAQRPRLPLRPPIILLIRH